MFEGRFSCAGILLALCAALSAGIAHAEVYKWVDEEGNVHFGDKPLDREQAEQAERVDIVEAYQPTERSVAEQSAYEQEQEALRRSREVYKKEDRLAREEEEKKRSEAKEARCSALKKQIESLSGVHYVRGVRTTYYLTDEDGKSLSSEEQRAYVAELEKQYRAAGCQ
jgi:hypothetical protein